MTLRNAVIGLAVVFGVSVWSWCRPCGSQAHAQAQGPEVVYAATDPEVGPGGNRDEAAARYRGNQCRHWRQVAMGR